MNFDKMQAEIDAVVQDAYDRGVMAGLQHFDRVRCWLSAEPFCVSGIRHTVDLEAKDVVRKYPRLNHPPDYLSGMVVVPAPRAF